MHLRDAWNGAIGSDEATRFEHQEIVLTVPGSFDEEARELTVEAARSAGLEKLTLLEEPLAAFYAWIAANRHAQVRNNEHLRDGELILICDIGGGTTDFSLIMVSEESGELTLKRVAVGDHILLGGDNMMAGASSPRVNGEAEISTEKLVNTIRLLNTQEYKYRDEAGRFATREELLTFLRKKNLLSNSPIDLESPKLYELAIGTSPDGMHYQITLKRPSDMNDKGTCWTRVRAREFPHSSANGGAGFRKHP